MRFPFLLLAVVLAGCATSYGPAGIAGGFTETRRGDDVYVVRFNGNGYTSSARAEEMVLLRAAELTLEKGFQYFTILTEDSRTTASTYTSPLQTTITGRADRFGNYRGRATTIGGDTTEITRPESRLLVGMSLDRSANEYRWITASQVVADLGQKYKRQSPSSPVAPSMLTPSAPAGESSCFLHGDGKCLNGTSPK